MTSPAELPSADWVRAKAARQRTEPLVERVARRLHQHDWQRDYPADETADWDALVASEHEFDRDVATAYRELAVVALDELLPLLPASQFGSYAARRDRDLAALRTLAEQLQRSLAELSERRTASDRRARRLALTLCDCEAIGEPDRITANRCLDGSDVGTADYRGDCPACVDRPPGEDCYAVQRAAERHDASATSD